MACVKSPVSQEDNGREKRDEGAVEEDGSLRVFDIVTSVGGWIGAQLEIALVDILNGREGGTSDEEKDDIPLSIRGDERGLIN